MLTSWFAIPYNLEGLNSDAKTVYHTGLGFNLSLDTVFLYRRQMTRFLCLPGIVFLVLFMEGAGLSRILASYKSFGTGSLPSVNLRPSYFLHSDITPPHMAPGPQLDRLYTGCFGFDSLCF